MAKNPYYVYALKDPRKKPVSPFYVGKGTGNRANEHLVNVDESPKGDQIRAIREAGLEVIVSVLADDLNEHQALKIEAELISAFGIQSRGGLLTNLVAPNPDRVTEKVKINVPDGCYEKAQIGLEMIKAAILELAKANPTGITNADVAKGLGLQSDYGGGSKDFLGYSVLGLLLKENQITRIGRKHLLVKN